MTWVTGEKERYQLFLELRASRIENRARLEAELAGDPYALAALYLDYEALVFDALQRQAPIPDPDIGDSEIVVNQNVW